MGMKRARLEPHPEPVETTRHHSLYFEDLVGAFRDTQPQHAWRPAWRKDTQPLKPRREGMRINSCRQSIDNRRHVALGDLAEEGQRQVHVGGIDRPERSPGSESCGDALLECGNRLTRTLIQVDGDEQAHRFSVPTFNAEPAELAENDWLCVFSGFCVDRCFPESVAACSARPATPGTSPARARRRIETCGRDARPRR